MLRQMNIDGSIVTVELIQRPRRSMELQIKGPNQLRVLVPTGLAEPAVFGFLEKKAGWIRQGLASAAEREAAAQARMSDGAQWLLLGKLFTLRLQSAASSGLEFVWKDGCLTANGCCDDLDAVRKGLLKWYRVQAEAYVFPRVEALARQFGLAPRSVSLSEAKKRWGSCTNRGAVRINTRCVQAPRSVIDYVIIHELSHLSHLNHSRAFWAVVAARQPDYAAQRNWLKQYGTKLLDW